MTAIGRMLSIVWNQLSWGLDFQVLIAFCCYFCFFAILYHNGNQHKKLSMNHDETFIIYEELASSSARYFYCNFMWTCVVRSQCLRTPIKVSLGIPPGFFQEWLHEFLLEVLLIFPKYTQLEYVQSLLLEVLQEFLKDSFQEFLKRRLKAFSKSMNTG